MEHTSLSFPTCSRVAELLGELVGDEGGEGGEKGRQEDADISNVDGDVEEVEDVVDGGRSHHQTRVYRASDDSTQRVPSAIVEPIVEFVKALLRQETSRPCKEFMLVTLFSFYKDPVYEDINLKYRPNLRTLVDLYVAISVRLKLFLLVLMKKKECS